MRHSIFRISACVLVTACALFFACSAAAETLQAPVDGKAFPLGNRGACAAPPAGWTLEREGRFLRPPSTTDALGRLAQIRLSTPGSGCAGGGEPVTLLATGRLPAIDPASLIVHVDDARAELRGKRLKGMQLTWSAGGARGSDTCFEPRVEGASEVCVFGIGRGVRADPAATFTWLPAGASTAEDATTFDETGRLVPAAELTLRPARVIVATLVPPGASLDVSAGTARLALERPEASTTADCAPAACEIQDGKLVVRGITQTAASLRVRFRLVPKVFVQRGEAFDAAPIVDIPILRCPMSIESGPPLRDVDDARVVIKLEGRCTQDVRSLRFFAGNRVADPLHFEVQKDEARVLLALGRVEEEVTIRAVRGDGDGTLVGVARSEARRLPPIAASLELEDGSAVDYIPTNRAAIVHIVPPARGVEVVVLPVDGVYSVTNEGGVQKVRATGATGGYVALRYAIRMTSLRPPLDVANVAVLRDPVQRPLREAHIPTPLARVVELRCVDLRGRVRIVPPGLVTRIRYEERDGCYMVMHRDRFSKAFGTQKLVLDIDVMRVDGMSRPEARVSEPTVLRPGTGSRIAWVRGVAGPFDRVTVRVAHAQDEQHYPSQEERPLTPPASQWSLITSTSVARMYLTAAIPTVLYRVSDVDHSGILSLNFGVLGRLTWVDLEGRDGILALEAGVIGVGLAPVDTSARGQSLRQVASVIGLGLGMPIANRALTTQASINLHAWFEYEISRAIGVSQGSPYGFIFGPSITFGNVGTYL
jgi:hypothetical protein